MKLRKNSIKRNITLLSSIFLFLLTFGVFGYVFFSLALRTMANTLINEQTSITVPFCGSWTAITGPGLGQGYHHELFSVSALADDDIWAVGREHNITPPVSIGDIGPFSIPLSLQGDDLVLHWDGNKWNRSTLPDLSELRSVVALAPDNVWVAGNAIAHWDGIHWSTSYSPNSGSENFNDIEARTANDIWAVGEYIDVHEQYHPLIKHWNGSIWETSKELASDLPNVTDGRLYDLAVSSNGTVWVVGDWYRPPDDEGMTGRVQPLVLRWNGTIWREELLPNLENYGNPVAIDAIAEDNVWAVGGDGLLLHWDGTDWKTVTNPVSNIMDADFQSIKIFSSSDIWVVGGYEYPGTPITMHWDGVSWQWVDSPQPGPHQVLTNIATINSNEIVAVGAMWDDIETAPRYSLITRFTKANCAILASPTALSP